MKESKLETLQYTHLYLPFTLLILFCIFRITISIEEHNIDKAFLRVYRKL